MHKNQNESTGTTPAKRKRVTRQPEMLSMDSRSFDSQVIFFSPENLSKLIEILNTEGFNGDFVAFHAKHMPSYSLQMVRKFFNDMARWRDPTLEEPTLDGGPIEEPRPAMKLAPIEEWISAVRESIEVQRLANNPSLFMQWVARFEEHPNPADSCGVDYKAIYFYLADLLEGKIPRQLDPPTASKLYMVFQKLVKTISLSAKTSQDLLLQTAKLPKFKQKIDREEKNRLLRERRREVWSEEEQRQAAIIKNSDNLEEVKGIYCSKIGLNPFSLPNTI